MEIREKIRTILVHPAFIIGVVIISALLSIFFGGAGTLFGFAVVFFTLWATKWKWSYFSIKSNPLLKTILKALAFTGIIIFINDVLFQPFIELFFGETDVSALDGIRGNWINYIVFLLIMWVSAAFGEEILYRGYFTKQLAYFMGNSVKSWLLAIVITSVVFGFAHLYQGVSGIITTGFIALIFGLMFYKNKSNLWVNILTHGFYDVFGITLIFVGKERAITEWIQDHLYFFLQ